MNIKDLEYFRIVCQQKSITKAAHLLYMTPQGLSRIMKNVENELDAVLFVRTGAGIQLTESGNYLYERGCLQSLDSYQGICGRDPLY
ncbi:MAG: LysR family transcriptional regulator [Lachnospiraceae bacterium]